MEIKACPRCGSTEIYQGTMGDGVLTGYTSRQVCRNCGFQGMPLIFNSEEDYKKFLSGLKIEKTEKHLEQSSSEKESLPFNSRPKGLLLLSALLIIETIIALFLFLSYPSLIQFTNVPGVIYLSMFMLTGIILPIGFLTGSSWSYTLGGFLFIFTIPFNLPLLYYLTRPHVKNYLLNKTKNKERN